MTHSSHSLIGALAFVGVFVAYVLAMGAWAWARAHPDDVALGTLAHEGEGAAKPRGPAGEAHTG